MFGKVQMIESEYILLIHSMMITQWKNISKPLREMRIALVTTAGIHFRGDPSFEFADATFRPISGEDGDDLPRRGRGSGGRGANYLGGLTTLSRH